MRFLQPDAAPNVLRFHRGGESTESVAQLADLDAKTVIYRLARWPPSCEMA
jgi:hypothetical protein